MSRTYRKSSLTERKSLVNYISREIFYVQMRGYYHEYYLTEHGKKCYEKAMNEYKVEYERWLSGYEKTYPTEPLIYHFKKRRVIYKNIDLDAEVQKAKKKYKKSTRDGYFAESDLNTTYKKYCAKNLRVKNRVLLTKILKGDDSWEQKPYPDTYLGKTYIWDYW